MGWQRPAERERDSASLALSFHWIGVRVVKGHSGNGTEGLFAAAAAVSLSLSLSLSSQQPCCKSLLAWENIKAKNICPLSQSPVNREIHCKWDCFSVHRPPAVTERERESRQSGEKKRKKKRKNSDIKTHIYLTSSLLLSHLLLLTANQSAKSEHSNNIVPRENSFKWI